MSGTRKLHIGGNVRREGWEILDAIPSDVVDHVCDAADLSLFDDGCFECIYASHVLEHFDFKDQVQSVLLEWHRVLAPGGKLMVSVPDLDTIAWLFTNKHNFTPDDRFLLMRMIFGGHVDEHDYHSIGFNFEFLYSFLSATGYKNITRVEALGLFEDTSTLLFKGYPISLNAIAEK
jgi:predicted SAM-dependent methyltransferase